MNTETKTIRILAADDHALVREGIASLISIEPDMELVAQASTRREAIEQFRRPSAGHQSLGPGIPERLQHPPPGDGSRHRIIAGHVILSKPVLGGLHHENSLQKLAA